MMMRATESCLCCFLSGKPNFRKSLWLLFEVQRGSYQNIKNASNAKYISVVIAAMSAVSVTDNKLDERLRT